MDRMSGGYPPPPGGPPAFPPPPDQQPPGFPPAPQSGPPGAGPPGFPPPSNPYGYQPPYGYPARPPGHYPLDLGRVLELTFSIFRYRWRTFVAIALVIMLPAWALLSIGTAVLYTNSDWYMDWTADMANYFRTGEFANPLPDLWPSFLANLAISVIVGIATSIAIGALTDVAAATYSGAPASAGASARRSLGRWRTYIGLYLMTTAITFVVVFLGVLVGLALFFATSSGGSIQPGPLVFFGLIVFVATFAALVFILIRFAFSVPVVMLESSGAVDALRRSWRLVSGSSWRVLGYLIVFGLLVGIVSALLATLVNIVINPVRMTSLTVITLDPARFAISTFVQGLITSVLMPLPAIGMMLLYFDLRWRRGERVPHGGSQPAEGAPVQPSAQPPYPPPPPG